MLWVLITWDDGIPLVRFYEDKDDAVDIYKTARAFRQYAYLYETDESGRMDLILETERM